MTRCRAIAAGNPVDQKPQGLVGHVRDRVFGPGQPRPARERNSRHSSRSSRSASAAPPDEPTQASTRQRPSVELLPSWCRAGPRVLRRARPNRHAAEVTDIAADVAPESSDCTSPCRQACLEAATVLARLYKSVRLYVNHFQPSFKLANKKREGAKVRKRYHPPATPFARLLADPRTADDVRRRCRRCTRRSTPWRFCTTSARSRANWSSWPIDPPPMTPPPPLHRRSSSS